MALTRGSALSSLALGMALAACARAPAAPAPATPAQPVDAGSAAADERGGELRRYRQELEAELAEVEAALAKLAPEMDRARWEQLADRRLAILVALLQLEQAIELGGTWLLPARGAPTPGGPSSGEAEKQKVGSSAPVERLIADAARTVAAVRRARQSQRRKERERDARRPYEKHTEYDFDDDVVDGDLLRPDREAPPRTGAELNEIPAQPTAQPSAPPLEVLPLPGITAEEPDAKPAEGRGASVVSPSALPADVMPEVARHLDQILDCFPAEQRQRDGLTVRVRTMLAADGSFRQPTVTSDAELSPLVLGCVTDVLARVRVPPPAGGSRVISFPLHLRNNR